MIVGEWDKDVFIAKNGEVFEPTIALCIGDDEPLFIGSNGTIACISEFIDKKEV